MLVLFLIILSQQVICHSWVDCLGLASVEYKKHDQIFGDDFYKQVCLGYPRSYPGRDDPDIGTKYTVAILDRGNFPPGATPRTTQACTSSRTRIQQNITYTGKFPMTKVEPGTALKLWYEMDGHRTDKPFNLYSFEQPNAVIQTHEEMKNSKKIFSDIFSSKDKCSDFDNDNSLCWSTWTVPSHWSAGTYSIVWNWPWDQNPAGDEYNTCFEVQVV